MPRLKMETYSVYKAKNPKFKEFDGLPKISFSAVGSWLTEGYRPEFIASKYLGIPSEGNVFTEFGSATGTLAEFKGDTEKMAAESEENQELLGYLSEDDIKTIQSLEHQEHTEFEREIVLKRTCKYGDYVIQGFIDKAEEVDGVIDVIDYKTGSIEKKAGYYGDFEQYQQTNLYMHSLVTMEGLKPGYCGVKLLDRKGNSLSPDAPPNLRLRLTGKVEDIETPYNPEAVEEWLKSVDKVAEDLCEFHKFMNKYFPIKK